MITKSFNLADKAKTFNHEALTVNLPADLDMGKWGKHLSNPAVDLYEMVVSSFVIALQAYLRPFAVAGETREALSKRAQEWVKGAKTAKAPKIVTMDAKPLGFTLAQCEGLIATFAASGQTLVFENLPKK